MAGVSLGSSTRPFKIKPIDFVCLGILVEFQSIKILTHNIQLPSSQPELSTDRCLALERAKKNYSILQVLLTIVTHIIFGEYDRNPIHSITDVHDIIRSQSNEIDQIRLHQLINCLNRTIKFAFNGSIDGLYEFINRQQMLISPSSLDSNPDRPLGFQADSPLGLYVRRCRLCISTLEFDQVSDIATQLKTFCSTTQPNKSTSSIDSRGSISGNSREQPSALKTLCFETATPSPGLHRQPSEITQSGHSSYPVLTQPSQRKDGDHDLKADPVLQAYLDFTDSYAPNYHKSSNALRKFYDNRSGMTTDLSKDHHQPKASRPLDSNHQEALLSLAKFHYSFEAYPTAMDALEEATRLARLAGDRTIIDECTCLRRRIVFFSGLEDEEGDHGQIHQTMPLSGPIQAQATLQSLRNLGHSEQQESKSKYRPLGSSALTALNTTNEWLYWDSNEEVFSVFKGLSRAEPLNHLHSRLFRASRLRISHSEDLGETAMTARSFDKVSWFALQARLWDLQGQDGLCEIYEDLALEVDDLELRSSQLESPIKLISKSDVVCHRALRLAKNGKFYHALLLMYELISQNQSDIQSFKFIQQTVLRIFEFKAECDENEETAFYGRMTPNLSTLDFYPLNISGFNNSNSSVHNYIKKLYNQAEDFIRLGNQHAAFCPIVSGISYSEKMNLQIERSKGVILWCRVMLNMQRAPSRRSTNEPVDKGEDDTRKQQVRRADWVVDRMLRSQRIVDLPGLISNSFLSINLILILIRSKILSFSYFVKTFDRRSTSNLLERIHEIMDLCWMADRFYQRTENLNGRNRLIVYQLAIITEALTEVSETKQTTEMTHDYNDENEAVEKLKSILNQLEEDLKRSWSLIQRNHQNSMDDHQTDGPDKSQFVESRDFLLNLFKKLLTRASVQRYL